MSDAEAGELPVRFRCFVEDGIELDGAYHQERVQSEETERSLEIFGKALDGSDFRRSSMADCMPLRGFRR